MKVIAPQTITSAEIESTNVSTPSAWSSSTTYDAGDLVSTSSGAKYWEAQYGEINGGDCFVIAYAGSLSAEAKQNSAGVFTALNVDIGAPNENRMVIVGFGYFDDGDTFYEVTGITINGITGTIAATHDDSYVVSNSGTCAIGYAMVPTGSSVTIEVTMSNPSTNISAWLDVVLLYGGGSLIDTACDAMLWADGDSIYCSEDDFIFGVGIRNSVGTDLFSVTDCTTLDSKTISISGEDDRIFSVVASVTYSSADGGKTILIDGGAADQYNAYAVVAFSQNPKDQVNLDKEPGVAKTSSVACYPAASLNKDWWYNYYNTAFSATQNPVRMFSPKIGEQTRNPTSIVVELIPANVGNALAFFNVDADSIRVQVYNTAGTGTLYDTTKNLAYTTALYSQIDKADKAVFLDMPDYDPDDYSAYTGDGPIKVTITHTGDTAACGAMLFGELVDLGSALYGTDVGITDYSRKEVDTFGRPTIIEREYTDNANYVIGVETANIGQIKRFLASLRATPAVYIGDEDTEETIVYGFFRDLTFPIEEQSQSVALLEVDGLV